MNIDNQVNAEIEREEQVITNREKNTKHLRKWEDFRSRRIKAIDRYIAVIRKKKSVEILVQYVSLWKLMKHHMKVVKRIKNARRIRY